MRRHPNLGRFRGLAPVALSSLLMAVLLVGADRRSVPVPPYLDSGHAAVMAAANGARSGGSLLRRLVPLLAVHELDLAQLWRTQQHGGSPGAVADWSAGRKVQFVGLSPWRVPANPSWSEDPYRSQSWLTRYHSLAWLRAPLVLYRETEDSDFLHQVRQYVLDWIADNPRAAPASGRAWYDHAVAYRTDQMVQFLKDGVFDDAPARDLARLFASLREHGSVLRGYLSEPRFRGHNHNLFHALSLYNLANAVPELTDSAEWGVSARQRIGSLLGEMVQVGEGVTTEEALAYHNLALGLFSSADRLLRANDDGLPDEAIETLKLMAEFSALTGTPDGILPAIGDTTYGAEVPSALLGTLEQRGIATPVSRFITSRGTEGTRPADLYAYPRGGLVVARTSYGDGSGDWDSDAHVTMDIGSGRRVHGHFDALSLTFSARGGPLIIDPGGPYAYGTKRRAAYVSALAHNSVIVDGFGEPSSNVQLLSHTSGELGVTWTAQQERSQAVEVRRSVALLRSSDILVVIDELLPTDERQHRYDLLYHLAPKSRTTIDGGAGSVSTPNGPGFGIRIFASDGAIVEAVDGGAPDAFTWVTTGYRRQTPSPVLRAAQVTNSGWYVTIVAPTSVDAPPIPAATVSILNGGLEVRAGAAGDAIAVRLVGGQVELERVSKSGAAP